jgi:TolA-binding protein
VLLSMEAYEEAIVEFNRVLTDYFEHELAASAQYRVGRCLDALDRSLEATSAYQLVVSGYPMSPQAPAAAYLAGAGLLEQGRPLDAAPYFQLVLDRYADQKDGEVLVFDSAERQELVEASLCLLELSYHRSGDLGQLSGVPHLMLTKMPSSRSEWRAYALLIDADAMAAQGRHDEAQATLQTLITDFPGHDIGLPANRLLAWSFAQQGDDERAIQIEERMLARYGSVANSEDLSSAYINKAHILFNNKKYAEAAAAYDEFYQRYPGHPDLQLALYQSGMCYSRLQQSGDAVDRWETAVEIDPASKVAERVWVRAGDLYFQAEYYEDAKRCYQGMLDNFSNGRGTALGMLRLAQCEFNAGNNSEALQMYSQVVARFPGTGIAREAEKGMEIALYRLGQSDDGGQVLAELVEQYPNSAFAADAQFEVAMRHYDAKEFEAAATEFRRVVTQFPSYSAADRAHFLMAESFNEAGNTREAKNGYEQFLMFFPESEFETTVRFKLGAMRFAEGDYMQAAVEFSTVVESEATEEILKASLFNLALCHKMIGSSEEAIAAFNRFQQKYPTDKQASEAAYMIGDLHETAGDYTSAQAEFERALAAKPAQELKMELYYRIGICREELGDIDTAISYYEKASKSKIKTDLFRLSALVRCAALYEQKGDFKKAIVAYRDLVKNVEDSELAAAAQERVMQLESEVE